MLNLKQDWQTYVPNFITISFIFIVIVFSYVILKSSVSSAQLQQIHALSQQVELPQTQTLAKQVLSQSLVNKKQYFQVVHAYQYEKKNIQTYPALDPNRIK